MGTGPALSRLPGPAITWPAMAIRLVLAEDHYLVREGLRRLIETQPELEVVAVCEDLPSLVAAIEAERPDVVLTDIRMPPTSTDEGVQAAEHLRRVRPDAGVVLLSQFADPEYALAFLEHGSRGRGYLLKERISDVDQLLAAIREVARGGSYIDPKPGGSPPATPKSPWSSCRPTRPTTSPPTRPRPGTPPTSTRRSSAPAC